MSGLPRGETLCGSPPVGSGCMHLTWRCMTTVNEGEEKMTTAYTGSGNWPRLCDTACCRACLSGR